MKREKKGFGEGIISIVSNYVMTIFINSINFYICNIPLLIFYILPYGFKITPESKYILVPTLLFIGPALTALYGVVGNFIEYGDVKFVRDYYKNYKISFIQSLKVWCYIMAIAVMLIIDINFFYKVKYGQFGVIICSLILVFIVLGSLYIFPIISRYNMKTKDLIKMAIFYAFNNLAKSISIIALFGVGLFLFEISPVYTIPFLPAVFVFLHMKIIHSEIKQIESKLIIDTEKLV